MIGVTLDLCRRTFANIRTVCTLAHPWAWTSRPHVDRNYSLLLLSWNGGLGSKALALKLFFQRVFEEQLSSLLLLLIVRAVGWVGSPLFVRTVQFFSHGTTQLHCLCLWVLMRLRHYLKILHFFVVDILGSCECVKLFFLWLRLLLVN